MPDTIEIQGLLLRTFVGINPEEQEQKQDVVLSLRMETDLREAGLSDDITRTVNYRTVCKQVIEHVEEGRFLLVERLAEEVAAIVLRDPRVQQVRVQVEKPGALRFARTVGVCIERNRNV